jgi:cobyrinic acid a,c-diamide synthase
MVNISIPRIVVGGTQSGSGKTSITLGLVAALRRRGLRVQTFKVGPDYLDPTYLALASGRPCFNLDSWMTGAEYVRDLVCRVCVDADVAIIEGVMGLFDGADPASMEGSTAEIALLLDSPVALVVDGHGMSRSFAAVVHGFTTFAPGLRIGGVIANRCGSDRHARWIAESLKSVSLPPLLGALGRGALPELQSRHLGLVSADSRCLSLETLNALADAVEGAVSLDDLLLLARSAGNLAHAHPETEEALPKGQEALPKGQEALPKGQEALPKGQEAIPKGEERKQPLVRLGIARDEAFQFYYPDNLAALESLGCELVPFSPMKDTALPRGVHGLYIGGGYPEVHAEALSANRGMIESIQVFAQRGGLIYAECGGLMYLSQGIESLEGNIHQMLGLLPARTRMRPRRKMLGYVEITLGRDSLLGKAGQLLRGHEFHYSELASVPEGWETAYKMRYRRSENAVAEGFQRGRVLASYAHVHFASQPGAAEHFVNCLKEQIP